MTKLTIAQKNFLRDSILEAERLNFEVFHIQCTTVAIRKTGSDMAQFAVAIASPEEPKFRKKVGKFHALRRIIYDKAMPIRLNGRTLAEAATDISRAVY